MSAVHRGDWYRRFRIGEILIPPRVQEGGLPASLSVAGAVTGVDEGCYCGRFEFVRGRR